MNWLSVDQATRKSGISYWKDNTFIKVDSINKNDPDFGKRLNQIRDHIRNEIIKTQAELVLIEGIQLESIEDQSKDISVETFKKLAMLQGVLISLFTELGVSYEIVPPPVWKSKVGIFHNKRKEQKKEAIRIVKERFGIEVKEDEAESILIGASRLEEETAW